ncbi:putative serine/threonine protein kinase [Blattamonas nauphoetae]|uniref:Serine/threonine protein kinase n=1 Tax=Blattamonas nauphoetae TaxID=2049346 RepID=A0ABQ9YMS4_9EUKA|nr:putative serine/threonine protein kinase [Blattamonas nauphoetae]
MHNPYDLLNVGHPVDEQGNGTFGTVLECYDNFQKKIVAIKVIRAIAKYTESARVEIGILQDIMTHDPSGERSGCVQFLGWFDFEGQLCIVTEALGPSLFDILRKNNYNGFPVDFIRSVAHQLLSGLQFLHETVHLTHTDLKPENILLVDQELTRKKFQDREYFFPTNSQIKIIDLGSATYEHEHHTSLICTRHYRPPEVILGLGWSYPVDIWSVGCILAELYTGDPLFQTHDDIEHLALMERIIGPLTPLITTKPRQRLHIPLSTGNINQDHSAPVPPIQKTKREESEKMDVHKQTEDASHAESNTHQFTLRVQHVALKPNPRIVPRYSDFFNNVHLDWPHKALTVDSIKKVCRTPPLSMQLGSHPSFLSFLNKFLVYSCSARVTASSARQLPFLAEHDMPLFHPENPTTPNTEHIQHPNQNDTLSTSTPIAPLPHVILPDLSLDQQSSDLADWVDKRHGSFRPDFSSLDRNAHSISPAMMHSPDSPIEYSVRLDSTPKSQNNTENEDDRRFGSSVSIPPSESVVPVSVAMSPTSILFPTVLPSPHASIYDRPETRSTSVWRIHDAIIHRLRHPSLYEGEEDDEDIQLPTLSQDPNDYTSTISAGLHMTKVWMAKLGTRISLPSLSPLSAISLSIPRFSEEGSRNSSQSLVYSFESEVQTPKPTMQPVSQSAAVHKLLLTAPHRDILGIMNEAEGEMNRTLVRIKRQTFSSVSNQRPASYSALELFNLTTSSNHPHT